MIRPSIHTQVAEENAKVDSLINQGYRITSVNETLSGAFVEFSRTNEHNLIEKEELQILTADARIHFSNYIVAEQRKQ